MSNRTRSNARNSRNHHDTATRKQMQARKRQKVRKQHMPGQNKLLMLAGLAILCVALIAPEILGLLGTRVAVIIRWAAVIAVILAIVATRYNMTVTECIGWLIDKLLNRDDDWDDDDDEWDDDEEWDDFDEDEGFVDEPRPAVRRRAPAEPAPVVEEAREVECTKENYELFLQFMEFQKAQKKNASAPKSEQPAPKTSKKS